MLHQRVSNYSELEEYVSSLEPPKPGLVRVFRGQSEAFPLVPSGRRRPVPRGKIWSHYGRQMLFNLKQQGVEEDIEDEMQVWMVWLQALAQHYGAGSKYLDVTHDLGMAAWFAFQTSSVATLKSVVGTEGDDENDSTVETQWVRLLPNPGPAFLYVLDLKEWTEGLPDPGDVVDLADAPEIFHSERIRVQSGCLAWGDEEQDLKSYAVAEIAVDDGSDAPYAAWSVEQVFPSPSEDRWYARFLALPLLLGPGEKTKEVCLRQALPVTLFVSSPDSPYVADIRSQFRYLLPPLVSEGLKGTDLVSVDGFPDKPLSEATVIILEGPQISAHPPLDGQSWNHELLLEDWSTEVDTYDLLTKSVNGTASLESVFIEISPLDEVGWLDGKPVQDGMLRAVWILCDGGEIFACLFLQDYPMTRFQRIGPIALRIDPKERRLTYGVRNGDAGGDIADLDTYGKAMVAALVLVRDLSPLPKAAAYPTVTTGGDDGLCNHVVPVSSAPARLFRVVDGASPGRAYVLRHPDGEPYTVAEANVGGLKVRTPTLSFNDVTAAEIREQIALTYGGKT